MDSIDADGNLGGIVTTWSPVLHRIEIIKHDSTLETKLIDGETETEFTILNVYGSFYNQKDFGKKSGTQEKWRKKK